MRCKNVKCGRELTEGNLSGPGRQRKYCSDACRHAAYAARRAEVEERRRVERLEGERMFDDVKVRRLLQRALVSDSEAEAVNALMMARARYATLK